MISFGLITFFFFSSITRYLVIGEPILPQLFSTYVCPLPCSSGRLCDVAVPVCLGLPYLRWSLHTSLQDIFDQCTCLSVGMSKPLGDIQYSMSYQFLQSILQFIALQNGICRRLRYALTTIANILHSITDVRVHVPDPYSSVRIIIISQPCVD